MTHSTWGALQSLQERVAFELDTKQCVGVTRIFFKMGKGHLQIEKTACSHQ